MRVYGKIESRLWQNPKAKKLSDQGKLLAVYIFACPHGNALGCFVLAPGYIQADLGWEPEKVVRHLDELERAEMIERDAATDLVRVRGWWGHNRLENANVAKNAMRALTALPQKSWVFAALVESFEDHKDAFSETVLPVISKGLEELFAKGWVNRYPDGSPNHSPNGSPNGSRNHIETVQDPANQPLEPLPKPLGEPFPNRYPNPIETKEPEPEPEPEPSSEAKASDAASASKPLTDQERLWRDAPPYLASRTGKPPDKFRGIIGRWVKDHGHRRVLDAIAFAQAKEAIDPVPFITACLTDRKRDDETFQLRPQGVGP